MYYHVTHYIGHPPKPCFLDIDTGSDLTWLQCDAPCTKCTPATKLVTKSIKVMMESVLEQELIKAKDDTNDTMKKLREVDKTCSQLQQNLEKRCFVNTSLEEKLCNLEDENHVLRQKALSSPKGSCPGFVKPFLELMKYSAALALPYADQKPVFENYEFLSSCIKEDLGFKDSKLVAACFIYKCLVHWHAFESERTTIFYYIIEGINEVLKASQASLEWLMKKRKAFDRRGDMVVAAWAEQQQQQHHEMNLRSSANYRWVVSCIAEATRSSMSPGSVHCSRACNLLGNATYYGFCKPLV
ncbi:unnamed protein product [Camellia sinensis]